MVTKNQIKQETKGLEHPALGLTRLKLLALHLVDGEDSLHLRAFNFSVFLSDNYQCGCALGESKLMFERDKFRGPGDDMNFFDLNVDELSHLFAPYNQLSSLPGYNEILPEAKPEQVGAHILYFVDARQKELGLNIIDFEKELQKTA